MCLMVGQIEIWELCSDTAAILRRVEAGERLTITVSGRPVAIAWARLVLDLRATGRWMPINDSWIAATAIARQVPLVSQDADYEGVPGLQVIRV